MVGHVADRPLQRLRRPWSIRGVYPDRIGRSLRRACPPQVRRTDARRHQRGGRGGDPALRAHLRGRGAAQRAAATTSAGRNASSSPGRCGTSSSTGCNWSAGWWPTAARRPRRSTTRLKHWDALTRHLDDGAVAIDNNHPRAADQALGDGRARHGCSPAANSPASAPPW